MTAFQELTNLFIQLYNLVLFGKLLQERLRIMQPNFCCKVPLIAKNFPWCLFAVPLCTVYYPAIEIFKTVEIITEKQIFFFNSTQ